MDLLEKNTKEKRNYIFISFHLVFVLKISPLGVILISESEDRLHISLPFELHIVVDGAVVDGQMFFNGD